MCPPPKSPHLDPPPNRPSRTPPPPPKPLPDPPPRPSQIPFPVGPNFKPPQSEGAGCGLDPRWGPVNRGQAFCRPPPPLVAGGSPPGGRATGAPGRKTGRKAQRHRGAPCGAGRTGGAPCGDIQQGGEGKQCATQGLPGRILEPTSCLLAMKQHGPFSSPGHVCDHEPFFFHSLGLCDPPAWIPPTVTPCGYGRLWGPGLCRVAATRRPVCAYPCLDTPNRDAVRLWTALGPGLCRVAATRHQVCAVSVKNSAALGFGGSEARGIVSRRGRGEGQTGSSGTRPLPAAMASANRDAVLSRRHCFWQK